jgi:hypothetical protein
MDANPTSDYPEITCIVTIHGIGFEQPPSEGMAGYADDLHMHLHEHLGDLLSDDPTRQSYQRGESVPIYVQSSYPSSQSKKRSREAGMKRLGAWRGDNLSDLDTSDAPLTLPGARIAHVALVYSDLEGKGVQVVPSVITLLMALSSLFRGRYDTFFHLFKMLWEDFHLPKTPSSAQEASNQQQKALAGQTAAQGKRPPIASLSVRQDGGVQTVLTPRKHLFRRRQPAAPDDRKMVFLQLQNDVAAYICSNDLREQIRSFVLDALLRLAMRKDVKSIVINAHSNGTVVAYDALCSLPPPTASKIKVFITAGSPLRKYTTLFTWGQHIDTIPPVSLWKNFWDEHDPVADPLKPCFEWLRGKKPTPEQLTSLYSGHHPCTGDRIKLPIEDMSVDNVTNIPHGEGLVAHNYWDNTQEFIPEVVAIVKKALYDQIQTAAVSP